MVVIVMVVIVVRHVREDTRNPQMMSRWWGASAAGVMWSGDLCAIVGGK
jgi:hypothetical protein